MKDDVLLSLKWLAIGKAVSQLVRWGATFFTLRLLLPEDYAVVALSGFFVELVWAFSIGGVLGAIVRAKCLNEAVLRQFFTFSLLAHLLIYGLLYFSAPFIASLYDIENLTQVLRVVGLVFVIAALGIVPHGLLNREMNFKALSVCNAIGDIVGALLTLYLAFEGFGFWALVYGTVAKVAVLNVGIVLVKPILLMPAWIDQRGLELIRFAIKSCAAGMLFTLALSSDVAIAGMIMSEYQLGLFQFALVLAMLPLSKVMPLLRQVALPAYASVQEDKAVMNYYYLKSQRMALIVMVPIFFGVAACAPVFVPLFFGEKWVDAAMVTSIFCLSLPLRNSIELMSPLLKAIDRVGFLIQNTLITLLIMVPCFIFGSTGDALGLAGAWLLGYSIVYIVLTYRACRVLGLEFKTLLMALLKILGPGYLMLLCAGLLPYYVQDLHVVLTLMAQILLGGIVYIGLVYMADRPTVLELAQMMPERIRAKFGSLLKVG